jgi:hypothetical protein
MADLTRLIERLEWADKVLNALPSDHYAQVPPCAEAVAALKAAEAERDEAVNWSNIVDRHGTDQFDDLAEAWLGLEAIKRVTNAVTSVFNKWANDALMERFRKHQLAMFHMAYVEGCLAGVKAAEAARAEKAEADLTAARAEAAEWKRHYDKATERLAAYSRDFVVEHNSLTAARAEIERLTKELATERADTFDEAASLAIPTYADDTCDVFRGMDRFRKQLVLKAKHVRALLGEQGK